MTDIRSICLRARLLEGVAWQPLLDAAEDGLKSHLAARLDRKPEDVPTPTVGSIEAERIRNHCISLAGLCVLLDEARGFEVFVRIGALAEQATSDGAKARDLHARTALAAQDFSESILARPPVRARLSGLAELGAGLAEAGGITGPALRAAGVDYDARRFIEAYKNLDLFVPLGARRGGVRGDALNRFYLMLWELRESARLLVAAPNRPVDAEQAPDTLRQSAPMIVAARELPVSREAALALISLGLLGVTDHAFV